MSFDSNQSLIKIAVSAVSFTPYGLSASLDKCQVDSLAVRGHNDRPDFFSAYGIWLSFWESEEDPSSRIQVGTFDGTSLTEVIKDGDNSLDAHLGAAFNAVWALLEYNRPAMAGDTPYEAEPITGLYKALARHGRAMARQYSEWSKIESLIANTPVTGRVWTFAGAWAAILSHGGCELVVIGSLRPPSTLALTPIQVPDSINQPSTITDVRHLARIVRDDAVSRLPSNPGQPNSLHPDELKVLSAVRS